MAKEFLYLNEVQKYFSIASDITKQNITQITTTMSNEELMKTENSQIAIFTLTYALAKHMLNNGLIVDGMAGHSLGQYVAVALAEVLTFEETCEFVYERSKIMGQINGRMLALLGVNFYEAQMIAAISSNENELCYVANYNSSSQVVISGNENAILRAKNLAAQFNKKAIMLKTSGPFHSPYMARANEQLKTIINNLNFKTQKIPIISNMQCNTNTNWAFEFQHHMLTCVLWHTTMQKVKQQTIIEIGPTEILKKMGNKDGMNIKHFKEIL